MDTIVTWRSDGIAGTTRSVKHGAALLILLWAHTARGLGLSSIMEGTKDTGHRLPLLRVREAVPIFTRSLCPS